MIPKDNFFSLPAKLGGLGIIIPYYPDKSAEMRYKRKTKSDWLKTFDCDVT